MRRSRVMFGKHRLQVLFTLAVLLLAVSVVIGSGAWFTSTSANPLNTFSAGNLKHLNSKDTSAVLTAEKMKPGDTASGTVTITNDGDIPGVFTLSTSNLVSPAGPNGGIFSDVLTVQITDTFSGTVYTRDIDNVGTINLGTWAAGQARTFTFVVTFPDTGDPGGATTGDNAYKQATMSIQFDWNSTETP